MESLTKTGLISSLSISVFHLVSDMKRKSSSNIEMLIQDSTILGQSGPLEHDYTLKFFG
jgi:hypothetical protein